MTTQPTREDYEHAARAAGIEIYQGETFSFNSEKGLPIIDVKTGFPIRFDPYNDPADAFRLLFAIRDHVSMERFTFMLLRATDEADFRHSVFWCAMVLGKQMKEV